MKIQFKFKNGQKVKDSVSGVVGIIDIQSIMYNGNIQYSVQPKSDDTIKRPDGWWFDEEQIEFKENVIPVNHTSDIDFKHDTGDIVKDKITRTTGTITRALLYLNGCIKYEVQPKSKMNKIPNSIYIDESAVINKNEKIHLEKKEKGGPSECSNSARM